VAETALHRRTDLGGEINISTKKKLVKTFYSIIIFPKHLSADKPLIPVSKPQKNFLLRTSFLRADKVHLIFLPGLAEIENIFKTLAQLK